MGLFRRKKTSVPKASAPAVSVSAPPASNAMPRPIASPQKPAPLTDEAAREIARQLSQYMKQKN